MRLEDFPQKVCTHCRALTPFWLWRLVEPGPHTYEISCSDCAQAQDAGFTAESAIRQARGIVLFERAVLSGRVVRDWGTM